jgi:hypothetical protein
MKAQLMIQESKQRVRGSKKLFLYFLFLCFLSAYVEVVNILLFPMVILSESKFNTYDSFG